MELIGFLTLLATLGLPLAAIIGGLTWYVVVPACRRAGRAVVCWRRDWADFRTARRVARKRAELRALGIGGERLW